MSKVYAFLSGRGGSGKTAMAAAFGECLMKQRQKVCLIDGCVGMRGLDMWLGLQDRVVFDFLDLAREECSMEQALIRLDEQGKGFFLAAPQACLPEELEPKTLEKLLKRLCKRFDYVLMDTPGGIGTLARLLAAQADECVLVSQSDDLSQRSTERISSLFRELCPDTPMHLLLNQSERSNPACSSATAEGIAAYLDIPLLGVIPYCADLPSVLSLNSGVRKNRNEKFLRTVDACVQHLCGTEMATDTIITRRLPWLSREKS